MAVAATCTSAVLLVKTVSVILLSIVIQFLAVSSSRRAEEGDQFSMVDNEV